jgi:hypothetical protein
VDSFQSRPTYKTSIVSLGALGTCLFQNYGEALRQRGQASNMSAELAGVPDFGEGNVASPLPSWSGSALGNDAEVMG